MVVLSRVLVPLSGLIVWTLYYFNGRWAYEMRRGAKRYVAQLLMVAGSVAIFVLQVQVMQHLAPQDVDGNPRYFQGLIFIECGGALVVLFATLLHGRAKQNRLRARATADLVDQFTPDLKHDDLPN